MRELLALIRASWQTERSYRLNMVLSFASLVTMIVPLFLVANALNPMMQGTIASESTQYFAFVLIGTTTVSVISASMAALPSALASAIQRGTLEAYFGTPTPPAVLFTGLSAYSVLWAALRAAVAVGIGVAFGAHLHVKTVPLSAVVIALLVLSYFALGIVAGAFVLWFRTTGPVIGAVIGVSILLGGVYYPTHVIPSWLQRASALVPLTYGLRALRQTALLGASWSTVATDVIALAGYAALLMAVGLVVFALAIRHARRAGSLGQY